MSGSVSTIFPSPVSFPALNFFLIHFCFVELPSKRGSKCSRTEKIVQPSKCNEGKEEGYMREWKLKFLAKQPLLLLRVMISPSGRKCRLFRPFHLSHSASLASLLPLFIHSWHRESLQFPSHLFASCPLFLRAILSGPVVERGKKKLSLFLYLHYFLNGLVLKLDNYYRNKKQARERER